MGKKKAPKLRLKETNVDTGFADATYNPKTGDASYELDPTLARFRDMFYGAAEGIDPSAEEAEFAKGMSEQGMGLFGRGTEFLNQALASDPQQVGQDYYRDIQNIMAPQRAADEARLGDTLFKTGRLGYGTGYGSGYVNPQTMSFMRSRDEQDQRLAIEAEALGRTRQASDMQLGLGLQQSGAGLYGQGYQTYTQPYQAANSLFGLGAGIEGLGMDSLNQAGQFAQLQMAADQAKQQNKADRQGGGLFGSGLMNVALQAGMAYMTGGASLAATAAMGAASGGNASSGISLGGGGSTGSTFGSGDSTGLWSNYNIGGRYGS